MIFFIAILFYISLFVLGYLCISHERQLLTHDVLEEKVRMTAEKARRVVKYANRKTIWLFLHYVLERTEQLFLSFTQNMKERMPKLKKKDKKLENESRIKAKKAAKKELPKESEHDNLM